jgi:hypothetical protein
MVTSPQLEIQRTTMTRASTAAMPESRRSLLGPEVDITRLQHLTGRIVA